jgi:hypothetical protein
MADSKPAALSRAAASEFLGASERVAPPTKLIALLALGHFVIDVNQGALPAVMPLLAFILTRFLPAPRETVAA